MVFIETPGFSEIRINYWDDEEYRLFQTFLTLIPAAGEVIRGTGGLRKIRWGTQGRGKRGGVRVIYYWLGGKSRFYLMTMYAKNEVADLTPAQCRSLKGILQEWKDEQT
jgi:mRNA-degrading endonuclease RelE of RelBE toxin-antitoxin system